MTFQQSTAFSISFVWSTFSMIGSWKLSTFSLLHVPLWVYLVLFKLNWFEMFSILVYCCMCSQDFTALTTNICEKAHLLCFLSLFFLSQLLTLPLKLCLSHHIDIGWVVTCTWTIGKNLHLQTVGVSDFCCLKCISRPIVKFKPTKISSILF